LGPKPHHSAPLGSKPLGSLGLLRCGELASDEDEAFLK